MFDINNKVALVTGGVSGIGFACAKYLLQSGLKGVTLADINEQLAQSVVQSLEKEFEGHRVIFAKTDVSDKAQFEEAFKATIKAFGSIDILINCAGLYNDVEWEKEVLVNFNGTINGTILAIENYLPKYRSGSEGIVVNIASISGIDLFGCCPVYSATKYGVIGLSRAFGVQAHYNKTKVRIVTVCPGATETPMFRFTETNRPQVTLGPHYASLANEECKDMVTQPTEYVAKAVAQVIREAETGSVWVAENLQAPFKVNIPAKYPRKS